MPNPNSTLTIQSFLNFCSTQGDLLPLSGVGGYQNEPGLSIANDVLSDLISDPNDWKFNRNQLPFFMTVPNKQDYLFAGAQLFCITVSPTPSTVNQQSMGWSVGLASAASITVTAGIVTATFLEPHRFSVGSLLYGNNIVAAAGNAAIAANYNSTFTDNGTYSQWNNPIGTLSAITALTVSWPAQAGQSNGDVLGAPGIYNFGYGTSASMQEVNNNSSPPNQYPLSYKRELPVVSRVSIPERVAMMTDLGTGVLSMRLHWVPSWTTFAINVVYQAKAPLITSLAGTMTPFPDNFAAVVRQGFIYRMYRYLNSAMADNEYKKLQAAIAKTQAVDDAEQTDVNVQPEESLMSDSPFLWGWS
jgi:hypothetical protein